MHYVNDVHVISSNRRTQKDAATHLKRSQRKAEEALDPDALLMLFQCASPENLLFIAVENSRFKNGNPVWGISR